jgi:hypothetical protein
MRRRLQYSGFAAGIVLIAFGVVVGIALLLSGIGFIVLAAFGSLRLGAAAAPAAVPSAPSTSAVTA